MCSISGYICFGDQRPQKEEIIKLFIKGEIRGTDASGIAYIDDSNKLQVFKEDVKSSTFVQSETFKALEMPRIMIMHTRAATQGDVKDNTNNHPIVNKTNTKALIHNGIINNENDYGIPVTEVDSKAIMLAYEKFSDKQELFDGLQGGYAVALLDEEHPTQLTLWRHTNPIELLMDTDKNILYFASTNLMLKAIKRPEFGWFGFAMNKEFTENTVVDNTYLELDIEKGLVSMEEYTPPKYKHYHYVAPQKEYVPRRSYRDEDYSYYDNYEEEKYITHWNPTTIDIKEEDTMMDDINVQIKDEGYKMIRCPQCKNITIIDTQDLIKTCYWCTTTIKED